jgi:carboxypeptidase Taq
MKNTPQPYVELEKKLQQLIHLRNLSHVLYWDAEVILPQGAAASRQQELATLEALLHELKTCKELGALIEAASTQLSDLDEWQKANLSLIKEAYEKDQCVGPELRRAHAQAVLEGEFIWRDARKSQNFKAVWSCLDHIFDLTRQIAQAQAAHFRKSPYDMLMDSYDPDRTAEEVQAVYAVLKRELPLLLQKIMAHQQSEQIIPLPEKMDPKTQKAIGLRILDKMGFDMEKGRLDEAAHPFCRGTYDDVRLTTRYDEYNFTSGLFAIIHEAGHGLYEQNIPTLYRNQPVGQPQGMSFHESQSLIMECQAGTSFEFIQFLAKLLRDDFGFKGPAYAGENLYKLINRVKPSFIRVEADEVTYPLHVILRFEIEQAIINDNLKAADLPAIWNAKMQEYLGIIPSNDREGCLQDVHWQAGLIGYFPCYTNGAIIASMVMQAAGQKYPNLKKQLSEGSFQDLNAYLNQHLRNLGSRYSSSQLLKTAAGEDKINPNIFLQYLTKKYLP